MKKMGAARVEIPDLCICLCIYVNMDVSVFDNVYGCGCLYQFVVHVRASKCAHGVKATSGPGASGFVMWTVLVYVQSCRVPKEHKGKWREVVGYSSSKVPHQVKRRRRRNEGGCLGVRVRSGRMAVGVFECLFFWCGESMAFFPLRRLEKRVCEWIFGSNLLCGPTRVSLPGVESGLLHPLSSRPLPRAVSRIDHKFHLLHSKRAVVRCYVRLVWRKANSARSRLGRCREIL